MEYLPQGDLEQYMFSRTQGPLSEEAAGEITYQVLEGLTYMHDNLFAHRDLKPGVRSHPGKPSSYLTDNSEYSGQIFPAPAMVGENRRFWYQ